jgi:hypothetical protein
MRITFNAMSVRADRRCTAFMLALMAVAGYGCIPSELAGTHSSVGCEAARPPSAGRLTVPLPRPDPGEYVPPSPDSFLGAWAGVCDTRVSEQSEEKDWRYGFEFYQDGTCVRTYWRYAAFLDLAEGGLAHGYVMLSKYEGSWTVRDEWLVLTTKEVPVGPHDTDVHLEYPQETGYLLRSADVDRLVISNVSHRAGPLPTYVNHPNHPFGWPKITYELRRVPPGQQIEEVLNARDE